METDATEAKQAGFKNFRNLVWHEAFVILKTILALSKTGYWHLCADQIKQHLFPLILILTADYEEQYVGYPFGGIDSLSFSNLCNRCVMALIRGTGCLWPCPICLVPWDMQSNLIEFHPLCTAKGTQKILKQVDKLQYDYKKEEILKDEGLRHIKVKLFGLLSISFFN